MLTDYYFVVGFWFFGIQLKILECVNLSHTAACDTAQTSHSIIFRVFLFVFFNLYLLFFLSFF